MAEEEFFENVRQSGVGEEMIFTQNLFVEAMLPSLIQRKLSETELAVYRRPFLNSGEDRRPTLTFPREVPFDGEPQDVLRLIEDAIA